VAPIGAEEAPCAEDGNKKAAAECFYRGKGGLGGRHGGAALVVEGIHDHNWF
jgi:hypothetical protein